MMEELQEKYYLVSLVYKLIASLQMSTDDKKISLYANTGFESLNLFKKSFKKMTV